jgi:alpha-tubulin suppressor-like RCC1 family protein
VLASGAVRCWGDDDNGELGDGAVPLGTGTSPSRPTLGGPASSVSAGSNHSCALLTSGEVWCWGGNLSGQVGDGTTTQRIKPVPVTLAGPATQVVAGEAHSCALLASGQVQCWGDNTYGQLGSGSNAAGSLTPVTVVSLP